MRLLLLIALALVLSGCPERKVEVPAALHLDKPDQARIQLDLASVRSAILKHQQMGGSYPDSLAQLGLKLFYPDDLVYDASNGTVKSTTYPMF